jgi:hypothetical protein
MQPKMVYRETRIDMQFLWDSARPVEEQ